MRKSKILIFVLLPLVLPFILSEKIIINKNFNFVVIGQENEKPKTTESKDSNTSKSEKSSKTEGEKIMSKLKIELGKPVMDLNSHGDCWDTAWGDDNLIYVCSDDTKGFNNQPGRNLQIHVLTGDSSESLIGRTINTMDEYGSMSMRGPDGNMWKANGINCIEGVLYMFVSRHEVDAFCNPEKKDNSKLQTAINSSLILSKDKGKTWQRTAQENYDKPMFPGRRLGSPYFIKYGKDGKGDVHQANKYVYIISNDGYWENGNDMILARVAKDKIQQLNSSDYQFHTGGDGMLDANWSSDIKNAKPIIVNPGKLSMTGAQYNPILKKYLMVQWYYTNGSGHLAPTDTTWLFYEAPTPWGPWNHFETQKFPSDGYYNPGFVSKFISSDDFSNIIFTNGNFMTHDRPGADCRYRLTKFPITIQLQK